MTPAKHDATVVVTVSSIVERDKIVKQIYTNLTADKSSQFLIQQDKVNSIKIFHNAGKGIRIPIRTYLVIVVPIIIDLKPLNEIYGSVDFHLDNTIEHLQSVISKLHSMQGHKIIKGNSNGSTLEQLVGILSTPNVQYGASKTF